MNFEQWKKEAIEYLHSIKADGSWDWILGDDEDMKKDGFSNNESPADYVDYQIECAQ